MIKSGMHGLDKNRFKFTICHHCGLKNQKVDLHNYKKGLCSQCFSTIYYKHSPDNFRLAFIYTLTALILFIPANIYPILTFHLLGNDYSTTFIGSAITLYQQDFVFVAIIIVLTAFLFPLINSFVIIAIYLKKANIIDFITFKSLNSIYNFTKKTSFIEVYLLTLLIGYIKLIEISDVTIHLNALFFIF